MNFFILLGVVSHFSLISCMSACSEQVTCGSCIGYAFERCVWCAQDNMNISQPVRCRRNTEVYKDQKYNEEWCPSHNINNPGSGEPNYIENKNFTTEPGKEIQFRPQKIKIKLRPGVPVPFNISYQPAKDFPLDMYFLMDNSFTMQNYSKQLAKHTLNIYNALKTMTNNVRLGIGSYVEKPVLPYSDPRIRHTYDFQHHLSLTKNNTIFEEKVNSYSLHYGSNYESPESGLDALMQVMKCDQIGWRDKSSTGEDQQARRIIILATDATYHSAGDGKMVGAFKPNDMECHLDKKDAYEEKISRTLDYPSVSQINYVAKKNNFIIVFAVLNKVVHIYEALTQQIFGAKCVELEGETIVKVIEKAYITASRDVKLDIKNLPPSIEVHTSCDTAPNRCQSTQANPIVQIEAIVNATNCNSVSSFDIQPSGIMDKLSVELEIDCECNCEKIPTEVSADCNSVGKKLCGVCKCNSDRSGDKCETTCSSKDDLERMEDCKEHSQDVRYCNDQGDCECGKCNCYNKGGLSFSGEFCQHNDAVCRNTCPADRGDCKLGKCICLDYSKWKGPDCSCPVSKKRCIGPFSDQPCSGRGACECGLCTCKKIDGKDYYGNYCESCKDCAQELCKHLKDYANCNFEKNTKEDCDLKFNKTSVKEVMIVNRTTIEVDTSATGCRKKLENGNMLVYKFKTIMDDEAGTAMLELMIQDELESPPVAAIWVTIGGVVAGIILIGLLTLIIWKVMTNMYDKKEYEKFCQEATSAGFDVTNPVYLDPNVNFMNPAYECAAN